MEELKKEGQTKKEEEIMERGKHSTGKEYTPTRENRNKNNL